MPPRVYSGGERTRVVALLLLVHVLHNIRILIYVSMLGRYHHRFFSSCFFISHIIMIIVIIYCLHQRYSVPIENNRDNRQCGTLTLARLLEIYSP
jgi:uncharacterized membrane protein